MIIMLVTVALNLTIQGFNINALTASAVPLDHYHIVITYTKPHKNILDISIVIGILFILQKRKQNRLFLNR